MAEEAVHCQSFTVLSAASGACARPYGIGANLARLLTVNVYSVFAGFGVWAKVSGLHVRGEAVQFCLSLGGECRFAEKKFHHGILLGDG